MLKPRLLFFTLSSYPLLAETKKGLIGGAEVQQTLLARELTKRGFKVSFIVHDYGQRPVEVVDGITVYKTFPPDYAVKGVKSVLVTMWAVLSALRQANADIYIQRADSLAASVVALFCLLWRRKFVFCVSNDKAVDGSYIKAISPLLGRLFKFAIKRANYLVVQSKYQQNLAKENFHRDSVHIKSICPLPDVEAGAKPTVVLWVGRMSKWTKQPELFLRLAEAIPHTKFRMVGGPASPSQPALDYYERLRKAANEVPNLEFVGFVPYYQVGKYFAQASVLVNTSSSSVEGFSNAFLQAWANYTPVVSLNADPDEVICKHKLGFHSRSFEQLVSDVKCLLANHKIREEMGMNGRQYVEREHNIKRTADEYERLLQQLYVG